MEVIALVIALIALGVALFKKNEVKKRKHTHKINTAKSQGVKGYWASMSKKERKKEGMRRAIVAQNNKLAVEKGIVPETGKRDGWAKRRISKALKESWSKMTPEQRRIRIDKMQRGRQLKKLLADKTNPFHT